MNLTTQGLELTSSGYIRIQNTNVSKSSEKKCHTFADG